MSYQPSTTGHDGTVVTYRQDMFTAFQHVAGNLNALHHMEIEAREQQDATASAQRSLDLFNLRYEDDIDSYLQVITWQTLFCKTMLDAMGSMTF
jgi:outer membrane protein TolC